MSFVTPGPRRKTNRWLVAGIGVAVMAVLGLLGYLAILVFSFLSAFGGDDFGPRPIDEQAAARAMERREIAIPAGFTFVEMTELDQFVGYDSYWGSYTAPGTFADAERALAQANPDYPTLRKVTCADDIVVRDFADKAGFSCGPNTELAVTTRAFGSATTSTEVYSSTPSDSETLLLVGNGERVTLFVLSQGH